MCGCCDVCETVIGHGGDEDRGGMGARYEVLRGLVGFRIVFGLLCVGIDSI